MGRKGRKREPWKQRRKKAREQGLRKNQENASWKTANQTLETSSPEKVKRVSMARPVPYKHHPGLVSEIFIALTSQTTPGGKEEERFGEYLKKHNWERDNAGNARLSIPLPDGKPSQTGFCAHMDDVSSQVKTLTHEIRIKEGRRWISALEKSILGADDKAGMAILLYLIDNKVPGVYHLFTEEESGMIGSRAAAQNGWGAGLKRMIAFDRRGKKSIITHQRGQRCCSEQFAKSLAETFREKGMNFTSDPTGSFTDSAAFMNIIPECTNISAGYEDAHGTTESQDIDHLEALAIACTQINWESLPDIRIPGEKEHFTREVKGNKTRQAGRKNTNPKTAACNTPEQNIFPEKKEKANSILTALRFPQSRADQEEKLHLLWKNKEYEVLCELLKRAQLRDWEPEIATIKRLRSDPGALIRLLADYPIESQEIVNKTLLKNKLIELARKVQKASKNAPEKGHQLLQEETKKRR